MELIPLAVIAGCIFTVILMYCIQKEVHNTIVFTLTIIYMAAMVFFSYFVYQSV